MLHLQTCDNSTGKRDVKMSLNCFLLFQTKYKKSGRQEAGSCLYSVMADTLDTQHAKQASQIQSQVLITHTHTHFSNTGLNFTLS